MRTIHFVFQPKLLTARIPHNYELWVASFFHPATHKTGKDLPCCGKRYCFVIAGDVCALHTSRISRGSFILPGGYRNNNGDYNNVGNNGNWWSSTQNDSNNAWNRNLNYNNTNVNRNNNNTQNGFSVRCLRDEIRRIGKALRRSSRFYFSQP